jgi:hypothetical protein
MVCGDLRRWRCDGAGSETAVMSPDVVVDNLGQTAPVGFSASARAPGSVVIGLSWRDPAVAPAAGRRCDGAGL